MAIPENPAVPNYPAGGNPYGEPPQKKSRKKLYLIIGGVVAVLLIAIVVVAVIAGKGTISSIDDAKAGDCITVSGSSSDATAKTAKCEDETFNFIVAEKLADGNSKCENDNYSELTQKDKGRLCLVPNFRVDKCYQVPGVAGGALTDFKEVECGAAAEGSSQVGKVVKRADSVDPECDETSGSVTFDKPKPLGYCIAEQGSE